MDTTNQAPETGCCPRFDPAPWDGKILEWDQKRFVKGRVMTFMYVPLNFGSVMRKMIKLIEAGGGAAKDWMSLSDHVSPWRMDLYVAVDKEIPGIENVFLGGKYLSKVYEGNFKETDKWMKGFGELAKTQGIEIKKQYMWYTTCPKCAKVYGKNYVVIVGGMV